MKKIERTIQMGWRWFGPNDTVPLSSARQAGATEIVSALHEYKPGEVWPVEAILERQEIIKVAGLNWTVVESLPVSEDIKTKSGDYIIHLQNYKQSLKNLAQCGIKIITYNFMPGLDWTRTDVAYPQPDGSLALRFYKTAVDAFDLFILQRDGARESLSSDEIYWAENYYEGLSDDEKTNLSDCMLMGLPGSDEMTTLEEIKKVLNRYESVTENQFRNNLVDFLKEVCPTADDCGAYLVVHPDDPPFSVLGLPRVVSTADDLDHLFTQVVNPSNGLCLCTGSLGARENNDVISICKKWKERIHFLHLRNVKREEPFTFYEANHLEGDVNLAEIVDIMIKESSRRKSPIPMRPDHGHQMMDDLNKDAYPGYTAIGRLRGLAELRGLISGLMQISQKN